MTQFDRHTIASFFQQGDSQWAVCKNLANLWIVCCMCLKRAKDFFEKSSKDLSQHLRDASGLSVDPSTFRWSLIRNYPHLVAKTPLSRKWNRKKRLRHVKWCKNWTKTSGSSSTVWWIPLRAWISTLLKQCGIILTENGTKESKEKLWNVLQYKLV